MDEQTATSPAEPQPEPEDVPAWAVDAPPAPPADTKPPRPKRPYSVTLLALGVLSIAGWGLLRVLMALWQWQFLTELPGISPLYIALSGVAWGIASPPLFWGLWRGLPWAPRLAPAVVLTYAIYYWLDVVFLMDHLSGGNLPKNWLFAIALTALLLGYTVWALKRPAAKTYFGVTSQ